MIATLMLLPLCAPAAPLFGDFEVVQLAFASLDDMRAGDGLVAFGVPEAQQGADLNGDGDQGDDVLHVHMVATGVTRNIGLALSANSTIDLVQVRGTLVAFEVTEQGQGNTDLDGDGNAFDRVLFLYDAATDTTVNLGFPGKFYSDSLDQAGWVTFAAVEVEMNTDLNGDGDVLDQVIHAYELSTGTTISTARAADFVISPVVRNGRLAFAVSESAEGADLTGDGDQGDHCLFTRDLASGVQTNWQIPGRDLQLGAERLAFLVQESLAGVDLAGDGERFDYVPHVLDFQSGTITNTGLAFRRFQGIQFDGRYLLTPVSELRESMDFNGDGDIFPFDDVLHLTDTELGTTTNLGLSMNIIQGTRRDKRLVALPVQESYEGDLDRNGDGDSDDIVLSLFDFQTQSLTATTTELSSGFAARGGFVASGTFEGITDDFNGNGVFFERVLFLHDTTSGTHINTRISVRDFQLGGRIVVYRRFPIFPAIGVDGTPTPGDTVGWLDLTDGSRHGGRLTANRRGYVAGDSFLAYATPERLIGAGTDANADGDVSDNVLVIARRP